MPVISASRLREIRAAKGLTQSRLATRADLGVRQIQRIETSDDDSVPVRENTLSGLAQALAVSEAVLSGGEAYTPVGLGRQNRVEKAARLHDFDARLVRLDGAFAVVEFDHSLRAGSVIARGIPSEAAGLRLIAGYLAAPALVQAYEGAAELGESHEFEELLYGIQREFDRFAEVEPPAGDVSVSAQAELASGRADEQEA